MLESFEFLNVSQFYIRFSGFIDLFIYTLVFVGVSQVTLGRRFPGRSGAAVRAGVGLLLAFAMVMAEERYGFNLRSLGPVAGGILVLLFGIVVYRLFHAVGLAGFRSAALAYVGICLAMYAVAPEFFEWLHLTWPVSTAIVIFAFFLGVLAIFVPRGRSVGASRAFERGLHELRENDPRRTRAREGVSNEAGLIKRRARPLANRIIDDSDGMLDDLESVEELVARDGYAPGARRSILDRMRSILPKGRDLQASLESLKDLNTRLLRLDLALFSERQRELLGQMSDKERRLLKKELKDEIRRIGAEKKIADLEKAVEQRNQGVFRCLGVAARNLVSGRINDTVKTVQDAIASEREAHDLAKRIRELENELLSLAKRDFKIEKRIRGL